VTDSTDERPADIASLPDDATSDSDDAAPRPKDAASGLGLTAEGGFGDFDWEDPWPTYDRLRSEAPIWRNPVGDLLLTRHADCEAVLRDARWSSNPVHDVNRPGGEGQLDTALRESDLHVLLMMDPPDHTRLRKLVSKAFTPRSVEQLRPRIVTLVDEILDQAAERGGLDVVADLGYELPVVVICEMLGVPLADRDQFAGWSSDATRLLDGMIEQEDIDKGVLAMLNFLAYFDALFDERRQHPGDDLVSRLLAVEEDGDRLELGDLRMTVILLFVAGHETTMNLIGNGTLALLQQRDQLERWRQDPALDVPAVEELLRFDGPAHVTGRTATTDLEVNGRVFPKATHVVTMIAAANRDPDRFDGPGRLDLARGDNHHLAFSQGMHYCLGAALARLEGQIALGRLIRRFPDMELASAPVHRDHFVLRGLTELSVSV
jgi:cytochrome P450